MFIDEAVVTIKAGDGGNGIIAFRREKYVPLGGPAGGNGGKGADIIFEVDGGLKTLLDFKQKKLIKGVNGESGKNKSQHGKNAENVIIKVPPGTLIYNFKTNELIYDLTKVGESFIIAKGGRGGRGNKSFATHSNPAPNISENGEPGEEVKIKLVLKLIAELGLVGLPSVGKSTLISVISNAKPKIADYEFTTLSPNLGVVKAGSSTFTVADLPGLIKGAHEGAGLGDRFLKHIERTKVISHVIDISRENPLEDYETIEKELESYSDLLRSKKRLIVLNKIDQLENKKVIDTFKKKIKSIPVFEVSALKKEGLNELIFGMKTLIEEYELEIPEEKVNYKKYVFEEKEKFSVEKESESKYRVLGLTRIYKMSNLTTDEGLSKFLKTLENIGVNEELEKAGIEEGNTVSIEGFSFEYIK